MVFSETVISGSTDNIMTKIKKDYTNS